MDYQIRAATANAEDHYRVLLDVGRILAATVSADALYRTIHQQTSRVFDLAGLGIALYDDASDTARIVYQSTGTEQLPTGQTFRGSDLSAIRQRRPVLTAPGPAPAAVQVAPAGVSGVMAPLLLHGRVLGVLCACTDRDQGYGEEELELLAKVADFAAIAISNVRLLQDRERRQIEAERLEEIGRALTATLDLPKVLERVVEAAVELTTADSAAVWLSRNEQEIEVAMTAGEIAPPRGLVLPVPPTLKTDLWNRQPFIQAEVPQVGSELPDYLRSITRAGSTIAVALLVEDELVGALSVAHKQPRSYSPDELHVLERLAYQAAIAVANARLHEQIHALSLTDPLTGMPNRRHLEMFLDKEFAAARRGRQLTLMLFDLDNFKEYNDRAGHQAGDEALRAFGAVLMQQTRAMNLAARYGGDEFVTVLADTDWRGGFTHATRIARAVAHDPLLAAAGIRASTGIASYAPRMNEPADLIRAADLDLYSRKRGERGASSNSLESRR